MRILLSFAWLLAFAAILAVSPPAATSQVVSKPKNYALLIGVNKYRHAKMPLLQFPEEDAKALGKLFASSGYEVDLLLGINATKEAISDKYTALKNKGGSSSVIVVGLMGSGVEMERTDYFCPYDTSLRFQRDSQGEPVRDNDGRDVVEPDPKGLVSFSELLKAFHISPAGGFVVLADCCRVRPNAARGRALAFGNGLSIEDVPENTSLLFACQPGQQAYEDAAWKHGAFTKCFLDEATRLSKVGKVTTGILFDSVRDSVEALVKAKLNGLGRQTPTYIATGSIDLQLASSPSTSDTATRSPERSKPSEITPPEPQSTKPRNYALLIGVTKYDKAYMNERQLQFPEADAKSLGQLFKDSDYDVDLLLGPAANRKAVMAKINALGSKGHADNVILIGLFGHGTQISKVQYFCPFDTGLRKQTDGRGEIIPDSAGHAVLEPDPITLVKFADLLDGLRASGAGGCVVLADCCRKPTNPARTAGFGKDFKIDDLPQRTSVLFACEPEHEAFEYADWGHGAFTKCLLDELHSATQSGNKVKTASLIDRLNERVHDLVSNLPDHPIQNPVPYITFSIDLQLRKSSAK